MKIIAYHGTNQDFETFSLNPPHRSTHGASADAGVFFTTLPAIAEQYAEMAHRKLVAGDHSGHEEKILKLVEDANRAAARKDFDGYERLMTEAEDLEVAARDSEEGRRVLEVEISAENPKTIPEAGRMDLHDMRALLNEAFASGHDAVIMRDIWDPAMLDEITEPYDHIVVRDPSAIRIVGVRFLEPGQPEEDGPQGPF